jgi:hypothetical protein
MINDYMVRWSTANRNNVAPQLTHYETDSFAIQNQASHLAFNLIFYRKEAAGRLPPRRSLSKAQPKSALAFLWSVRRNLIRLM